MKKTVTIDARWLLGGIGTYTRNLLQQFQHCADGLAIQAIVRKQDSGAIRQFCDHVTIVDSPIYTLREQLLIPRASRNCDLLHVPHFNAPLLYRGPLIVSIMDVIHLTSPAYRNNWSTFIYARPMLRAAARKAARIITVSNYSKAEIARTLDVSESCITVIPCGVGEEFTPNCLPLEPFERASFLGLQTPFLLYVGNLKPHKNVPTLLRAFAELRRRRELPHSLLIVGDDPHWKWTILQECRNLGISECTKFLSHVAQSLLPRIYASADLLVMPSTLEGFGLPVLEAMACGTPVISSRVASLPEVGGEAVLYFEPTSSEALAFQIDRVLQSRELRASLRKKGIERAGQFSWKQSARRHAELYSELLGRN